MTDGLSEDSTDEEDADPAKKKARKAKKMKTTLQQVTKMTFWVSSVLLIAVAAMRFTIVDMQTTHEAIMNCYFFFFGIVVAL